MLLEQFKPLINNKENDTILQTTYILHNAHFHSMIEVRTQLPVPEKAIQWKRMLNNSICIRLLQKRCSRSTQALTFHELNRTFLTTLNQQHVK